ncbi:alpha/beta hydrolase [Aggregicoccus sp. 17bor-14]|uniref:alpha/beta hydrolase n=1 Tax=Myxococcaceae TaxID=31 RepID=UPI00129C8A4E|nr:MULTISPECIES: alpha/beta hydrolase [Myxococcaceae]MBF5041064.1 alpha/beta hydrolase [Simulacricoccus sp. 17bor-14]MRI86850.1 alpha/beta hydrolase [Aggregicoccus sp. 17bor-14]
MVLKGQFLERSTLIPVDTGAGPASEVMEGTAHRGERQPPLLILPPRPEEGGGMDHVLAAELAFAAARAGHATLRFNYRGVGASQGARGDQEALGRDAAAALDVALENARGPAAALAALHGSAPVALALLARRAEPCALALVEPRDVPLGALARVRVPLLVIAWAGGDRRESAAMAEAVSEAGGRLELVSDAAPTFPRNLPVIGHLVAEWLQRLSGAPDITS